LTPAVLIPELSTQRLLLRAWRAADGDPFAAMNADTEVMRHYPSTLTRAESDARVGQYERAWARDGIGKWAVEIPGVAALAGSVGLAIPPFEASFTPCVEVGWRLAREHWGHGYATEAARAALEFGFHRLGLERIVAFAIPANTRSVRVMEKLGMRYSGEFAHPLLAEGHRLRRHVLYLAVREYYA
jgi:RimJ/RimL family protein N-acetyltransferase